MPKIEFQIRFRVGGEVQPPLKFGKLKLAKKKAMELSTDKANGSVQLGEVELDAKGNPSRLIQVWDFAGGEQTGHELRDGATPIPAKAGTESNDKVTEDEPAGETGSTNEEETMAKTPKMKKSDAKVAPKAGKGKTAPKAGKSPTGKPSGKASTETQRVTGKAALAGGALSLDKVLASFGAREGTNKAKAIACFYENRNKTVATSVLVKAVYGKTVTDESRGAIKMVINGIKATMEKEKLPFELLKEKGGKDDKEICYGLGTK